MKPRVFQRLVIWLVCTCIFISYPANAVLAQSTATQKTQNLIRFVYSPGHNLYWNSSQQLDAELQNLYPDVKNAAGTTVIDNDVYMRVTGVEGNCKDVDGTPGCDGGNASIGDEISIPSQTYGIKADVEASVREIEQAIYYNKLYNADPNTDDIKLNTSLILVGQSQGGIRARTWLQLQAGRIPHPYQDTTRAGTELIELKYKIDGLATISSPNLGGPALKFGVGKLRREVFILNSGLIAPLTAGAGFFSFTPGLDQMVQDLGNNIVNKNPGVVQMQPESSLLKLLNGASTNGCVRQTYYQTVKVGMTKWRFPTHYTLCPVGAKDQTIPTTTALMSIRTANSDPDAMFEALTNGKVTKSLRTGLAVVFGYYFALFTGISFIPFQWWAIPIAIACGTVFRLLIRLPAIYNEVIGSTYHDGLFPVASQAIPTNVGGYWHQRRQIPEALHDYSYNADNPLSVKGALGQYAYKTAEYLQKLEERVRRPR